MSSKQKQELLILFYIFLSLALSLLIGLIFFFFSKKVGNENQIKSIFECGFTSYFFSRISISIHYFIVGLIFLFLDLELCYTLPFFFEGGWNFSNKNDIIIIFLTILITTLLYEWVKENLNWKY